VCVHQILYKSRKQCDRYPGNDRQASGEERMSYTHMFGWKSPHSPRPKKAGQVNSEVKSMLSSSLTLRGPFTRNSSWQTKQFILDTYVMFYSNCVKMCEYFALNFGDERNLHPKQHGCHPPPILLT
jgi:hypothetical protein